MKLKEAAQQYGIPKSRVEKAVRQRIVKAAKDERGRWEIDADDLAEKMKKCHQFSRDGLRFNEVLSEGLLIKKRNSIKFSTTAGAQLFEDLHRKNRSPEL